MTARRIVIATVALVLTVAAFDGLDELLKAVNLQRIDVYLAMLALGVLFVGVLAIGRVLKGLWK